MLPKVISPKVIKYWRDWSSKPQSSALVITPFTYSYISLHPFDYYGKYWIPSRVFWRTLYSLFICVLVNTASVSILFNTPRILKKINASFVVPFCHDIYNFSLNTFYKTPGILKKINDSFIVYFSHSKYNASFDTFSTYFLWYLWVIVWRIIKIAEFTFVIHCIFDTIHTDVCMCVSVCLWERKRLLYCMRERQSVCVCARACAIVYLRESTIVSVILYTVACARVILYAILCLWLCVW